MNEGKTSANLKILTVSALFAALVALGTYLIRIPIGGNGGYMHFGDTFIYLAASILPTPFACAAAAIGGGLADFLAGAPAWIAPTVVIKALIVLPFTAKSARIITRRNGLALLFGAVITIVGYYIAEALIFGNWITPIYSQWGNLVQAAGSAALYAVAGAALDRLSFKDGLKLK